MVPPMDGFAIEAWQKRHLLKVFVLFSTLFNGLFMPDEGRYEILRMVVDFTLFSAFKVNVSKWEPIFFHFFVVVAFFATRYMIVILLFECSMSTRPKN